MPESPFLRHCEPKAKQSILAIILHFPSDIAPFRTVWGAEINVELALILETENLVNFQNSARIRQNGSRPEMGVARLCLLLNWFTRATVSISSFGATLFSCIE